MGAVFILNKQRLKTIYNMNLKKMKIDFIAIMISLVLIIIGFVFKAAMPNILVMIVFGLAFAIGGYAKAKEGVIDTINNKALNVEILMILAALGAFIVGHYEEGAILILIFGISGVLETYATSKSEKAFKNLLKLAPADAIKLVNGNEVTVFSKDLDVDDVVIVKAGQQIPADGVITVGETSINESAITGEYLPVEKHVSQDVFAGTINITSTINVKVTKNPKESIVQKIIDFVETAQNEQTKTETYIEKIEKYYVYIVIVMSIIMMLVPPFFGWLSWTESFYRGIVILVVGSPCALVASVSPAVLSSLSNAARSGILIKGGSHLEQLVNIDTVVFDKTGTLTIGKPSVIGHQVYGVEEALFKDMLYSMELQSNHPLANAVVNHFNGAKKIDLLTEEKAGYGMSATIDGVKWFVGRKKDMDKTAVNEDMTKYYDQGATLIHVFKDDVLVGFVALKDTLRKEAKKVITELIDMGITPIMLTGDNEYTASAIAKEIGIKDFRSGCFPESKASVIEKLKASGKRVLMIGDGINDAPALVLSDVGAAMGEGTDVSLETADMVFMNNQLTNITKSINLGKRMKSIILQNVIFSISVIVLLLITNLFGLILLPIGVIAHEGSTILVILSSLRLLVK